MRIILWRGTDAIELRTRWDAGDTAAWGRVTCDPRRAAEMILRASSEDRLYALLRALRVDHAPRVDRARLRDRLVEALRRGELVLWRRPARARSGDGGAGGAESDEELLHTPSEQKTWIEIELVDMEGNPMPGEPYRIKLPDGTERRGTLDSQGRAYFGNLDPGQAEIFWEARDGDATESAPPLGQGPVSGPSGGGGSPVSIHERHWVELELLDMEGEPVPHERYWIKLPDGTVRQGNLDARGLAYFDDLDLGECEIRWPGRDEDAAFVEADATAPAPTEQDAAQVAVLLSAAREGTPFCEECERARQAEASGSSTAQARA